jgi:catechol 2,3-dioxygenase-like lactoylglutathione lyase family enzyme
MPERNRPKELRVPFSALDHVGITVSDMDRSIEFYSLLLGEEPMFRETWNDIEYVGRVVGYRA